MKIRNGFVSNSSSQAFVIRGIEVDKTVAARILQIPDDEEDIEWGIVGRVEKAKPLEAYSMRDFFERNDTNSNMVIGYPLANLEDGEVAKLKEPDDDKIKKLLEKLGFQVTKLHTYVQYIGNDNF